MSNTLPKNWTISTLGEISLPSQYGFTAKAQHSGNTHYLRTTDITSGSIDWNNVPFCDVNNDDLEKFKLYDGDILISRAGSVGYSILVQNPKSSVFASYLIRFRPLINSKYFSYYLNTPQYWDLVKQESAGIAVQNLNASKLSNFTIPIAPINEQEKIVSKIDELFSELDNGIEELETAQKKLELYRQSLLKSAVEGELSKAWRETQTEISETGEQLLARILKERRERWEQEKLKEFAEKGKNPPKNWQEKYPEPVQPDTENLPELPEGWVWASIDQLTTEQRYGSSAKTNDDPNGIPVLRMGNIQNGALDFNNLKYLPKAHDEFPALFLEKGDLLFNRTNSRELVGKTAIFNGEHTPCSYASYLIKVKFHSDFNANLAAYYINSVFGKIWINDVAVQQTGQANVNGTKLSQLCIPLMSQAEQNYIVERFNELKDASESSFKQIEDNIKLLTMQKQNILKDAFSGKLVPQNPSDEPAQVLLERIQQQRELDALAKKASPKKRLTPKAKKEVNMSKSLLNILKNQSDWISGQDLATAFGLNGNSKIEEIEQFYEQLRTLSLDKKILVKPDQQNKKEQDLIKLKDKTDAS
ncbi:restriction endonuclease subunit S [Acinetobacter radioresistens]|uniref:restriction endonuclease subunit S n=1 Tax=Acinetobacter radioresistens TaxID=40216 RepID=UPI0006196B4E|nr:restriction endonuclease subunit S [Acinetobacter radioresistens]